MGWGGRIMCVERVGIVLGNQKTSEEESKAGRWEKSGKWEIGRGA